MTDRLALLKAILAAPDDDLPRLVYADWLEENGTTDADAARAEFIRLGCLMKVKDHITPKETKWLDANWQRLLPATLSKSSRAVTRMRRLGKLLTVRLGWRTAGQERMTRLTFEYINGFARRVEFSNARGYDRFWQLAVTDEPLAFHQPRAHVEEHWDESGVCFCRLRPRSWGDDVYRRATGFETEEDEGKVYRDQPQDQVPDSPRFNPHVFRYSHELMYASYRIRVAVATAMTARAWEFVGLV